MATDERPKDLESLNAGPGARERGLSLVTAIFLMVVLAMLGAFMVSVTGMQQSSSVLDVQGVRAYEAARAGVEWGAWKVLDPNDAIGTYDPADCPSTTELTLAGSLSPFTVTVTCTRTLETEGYRNVAVYLVVATACNQPSASSPKCPNSSPSGGYLERQVQALFSKCKDTTASAPKFACG